MGVMDESTEAMSVLLAFERRIATAFAMGEATWERHANPWSVWTRTATLPLLIAAIWSRVWWGWGALVALGVAMAWIWLNPRVFPKPASTNCWASKAVLGERVWLNRGEIPVPPHHRRAPFILGSVVAVGIAPVIWGVTTLELWPTMLGTVLTYCGKLWFLDRMVWLFEDMKGVPEYSRWLYEPVARGVRSSVPSA